MLAPPPFYVKGSHGGADTCNSALEIWQGQILMLFLVKRNKFCRCLVANAEGPFTTMWTITRPATWQKATKVFRH